MPHLIQRIKVKKQFIAELAAATGVVLCIHDKRLDSAFLNLGKHIIEKIGKRIVLPVHALVELQVTDTMVRKDLIVIV